MSDFEQNPWDGPNWFWWVIGALIFIAAIVANLIGGL